MNRPWDKDSKYDQGILKEYKHWILELSYRQHTLGSFILFARRDIENIHDLTTHESEELKLAMREMETALLNIEKIKPDKFNYWQMGNNFSRLHFHGIPRYKEERLYAGKTWTDDSWGSVPEWSYQSFESSLIREMRDDVIMHLPFDIIVD